MQAGQGINGILEHGGYEIRHRTTTTVDGRFTKTWLNFYRHPVDPVDSPRVAAVVLRLGMPNPWPQTAEEELEVLRRRSTHAERYIREYIEQGRVQEEKVHEITIEHDMQTLDEVAELNDRRYE